MYVLASTAYQRDNYRSLCLCLTINLTISAITGACALSISILGHTKHIFQLASKFIIIDENSSFVYHYEFFLNYCIKKYIWFIY